MTGLMPTQHGVWHNVNVTNAITRGMKEHVRPWSVDMKEAGYRMCFTGEWHVSDYIMTAMAELPLKGTRPVSR